MDSDLHRQLYSYARDFNQLLEQYEQLVLTHEGLRQSLTSVGKERSLLENLLKTAPLLYLLTDQTGRILEVNGAARDMASSLASPGESIAALFSEPDRSTIERLLENAGPEAAEPIRHAELFLTLRHGCFAKTTVYRARVFNIPDHAPPALQWILTDHLNQDDLADSPAKAIHLFRNAPEGVVITDQNARILAVNPAFTRITGYSLPEALGQTPRMLHSGVHDEIFYQDFWRRLIQQGFWQGEIFDRRKDGTLYPAWYSVTTSLDEQGKITGYIGMFSDITRKRHAEQKLSFLAHHDPLTGLPNRTLFQDRLAQQMSLARRDQRPFTLAFIDLDKFKQINDEHGHQTGDNVLKAVAGRIRDMVREVDTVARIGGDEFVILAPGLAGDADVHRYAINIIAALLQPIVLDGQAFNIGASLGTAQYPRDGSDESTLLRLADSAMYQAKLSGGNRHLAHGAGDETLADLMPAFQYKEMHKALQAGQFHLLYQPLIAMAQGYKLMGVEALIRWRHPEHGDLMPDRFLPAAEQCGFMLPLGQWVLDTACAQLSRWDRQGLPGLRMAVNVSPLQLRYRDFQSHVLDALSAHGLGPERLELEMTESEIRLQADGQVEVLTPLRDRGVKIVIDDFGTGNSSLSRLRLLPVDRLKIDQSFIRNLEHSGDARSLSGCIISMSKALGLEVVAEGVETQFQFDNMKQSGCDFAQGFLMARPMTGEELLAWSANQGRPLS